MENKNQKIETLLAELRLRLSLQTELEAKLDQVKKELEYFKVELLPLMNTDSLSTEFATFSKKKKLVYPDKYKFPEQFYKTKPVLDGDSVKTYIEAFGNGTLLPSFVEVKEVIEIRRKNNV